MSQCRYCSRVFETGYKLSGHMRSCEEWKRWRAQHLTADVLQKLYVDERRSMPEIVEMLNLPSVSVVYDSLRNFGIPARNITTATRLPGKRERQAKTCLARYGTTNPLSAGAFPRQQMEEKLMREHGVRNVFQLESVKGKIRDSLVSRPESITSRFSNLHKEVFEFVQAQHPGVELEFKIAFPEGHRSYDIRVGKKLIEVQGDYWHANPKKYSADKLVEWSMGTMTAQQVWDRDRFKAELAMQNGFELLVVWESDWKNSQHATQCMLREFLARNV